MKLHYLAALLFWSSAALTNAQERFWALSIQIARGNGTDQAHRFELGHVSQTERLRGTWFYQNTAGPEEPLAVRVEGVRTADGVFWPEVEFQIRDRNTGLWKTIGRSSIYGVPATLTIAPNATSNELWIELDSFKPFLRDFEAGRVVLKSGETSEFELKYLLPPQSNN